MNIVAEIFAALAELETTGSATINTPAESEKFTVFGQNIEVSVPTVAVAFKKV